MTQESRQKADASLRVDEQGGILVGLRLDPALVARRPELTDPARISETEERLYDFAARLDEIEALGDLFDDDLDAALSKPASAPAASPADRKAPVAAVAAAAAAAPVAEAVAQKLVVPEDLIEPISAPMEAEEASEGHKAADQTETGAPEDLPGLRPPGADDFDEIYGRAADPEHEPAAPVHQDDADDIPAIPVEVAEEDFSFGSFKTIDEDLAARNARLSEEVIEISEIDNLPEDAVEDFAWKGFDQAGRDGWEAVEDDRDPEDLQEDAESDDGMSGFSFDAPSLRPPGAEDFDMLDDPDFPDEEDFGDDLAGEDLGPFEQFLVQTEQNDIKDEGGDAGEFLRQPEDSLEDVLRDDIWLEEIMPDEPAPEAKGSNEEAYVWENPMTRTETEISREPAREDVPHHADDLDPLGFLDEDPVREDWKKEPAAEEETLDPIRDAGAQAPKQGILGMLGVGAAQDHSEEHGRSGDEPEADALDAETDATGPAAAGDAPPAKGSRLPLIAASVVLAAALGFGLVNMGVIPMGSGSSTPDVMTAAKPAPTDVPVPATGMGGTAEASDPLSEDLAALRDTAPPVATPDVPAPADAADQLDRVAKGLEAAADGEIEDLFLPETAAPLPAKVDGPVVTQEVLDALATDADIAETKAAIDRMFADMQAMAAKAEEREAVIGTLQSRIAEIETLARRAETLALAQNEVIVDVVRLQEQMLTAEELIVDLSRRVAAIEAADPADRVSVDRSLEDLDRRISGLSRDVGLVARMTMNGSAAPLSMPVTATPRTSEPAAPGAGAVYQDSNAQIGPAGSGAAGVPAGVKVGDFVDRYGYVLDIVPTSDGARLVVMENGSVIIP